ncbi:MAG TPA: phosphoribosylaminoimidazolesuccinocarboxamide synthase, partial [Tepidisphaeraceae bacterium]|nr:phosphoribosylaminoimidazolesuccinocarboxamide synthase [Tepidisphaeraceae bacterium]
SAILKTDLPFPKKSGKVRDVYDLGNSLLIVATDRISAFDVIMQDPIPGKGTVLTALSLFWFEKFKQFDNHLIASEVKDYPKSLHPFASQIERRSMLVRKADVVPIECVARGYLAGSGWKEYQKSQTVCKIKLPAGLRQCDKLPTPIFTPATKEESGHDINISPSEMGDRVGKELASELEKRTLSLYSQAADYAATRGIIIADTKFEFGIVDGGKIILIDEVLTPDSSRFWPADEYQPGRDQASFDKQFLRNWLEAQPWDKNPPAPRLPAEIIDGTRKRYFEAYERITGRKLAP